MEDRIAHSCAPPCLRGIEGFRGSVKAEGRGKEGEAERVLRGCGPNYPQWLSRTRKRDVSLGSRKDGASEFFSSFSACPPREDVSNRFSATRLQVVLRMALRELPCVILPALIREPA